MISLSAQRRCPHRRKLAGQEVREHQEGCCYHRGPLGRAGSHLAHVGLGREDRDRRDQEMEREGFNREWPDELVMDKSVEDKVMPLLKKYGLI